MWIGSIKLAVWTGDAPDAGTDNLVLARLLRDGTEVLALKLDYPTEDDLEPGAFRNYWYLQLPRRNHLTPELPPGIGQIPPPYPSYGVEYSNGIHGHLALRLTIGGDDLWIKDRVDLQIKQVRPKATSFDMYAWKEDTRWSTVASWGQDVPISTDTTEGHPAWTLAVA